MNLNKCCRCSCFYSSEGNVCPNCQPKDFNEIAKLKNYFDVNSNFDSIECISANTGITLKNLNRFLNQEEFSKFSNKFNSSGNIGIDL
jgi:hypothetical protein